MLLAASNRNNLTHTGLDNKEGLFLRWKRAEIEQTSVRAVWSSQIASSLSKIATLMALTGKKMATVNWT